MADHVVALFKTTADASTAVDKLVAAGISDKRISVLMGDSFRGEHFGIEDATKAPEGATTGGLVGGTLGAIAGSLVAVGSLALPGVGIVLAGPIAGALAGAGAGAAAGGLVGGLIGLGVPEHQAKVYEDAISNNGGMLLGVETTDTDEDTVKAILRDAGGEGVYET